MSKRVFAERNGRLEFVGDFDGLYAENPDPWGQSGEDGAMGLYYRESRSRLLGALMRHRPGNGLEVGCGHGHLTEILQSSLMVPVVGMDISDRAIRRAEALRTGVVFVTGDISSEKFLAPGRFGFVVWAQVLWYLLERIDTAIDNTLAMVEPGGLFVVSQAFLRDQQYGREVADGFDGALARFLSRGLHLIEARHDDADQLCHRDGLMIFRKGDRC